MQLVLNNCGQKFTAAIIQNTDLLKHKLELLSLWLIGTVRAEPETVISRAWVQSPDPAK